MITFVVGYSVASNQRHSVVHGQSHGRVKGRLIPEDNACCRREMHTTQID